MNCLRCGSNEFEEENGLFYCRYCQTQSQGFVQESEQTFIDLSKYSGREVVSKRKPKRKSQRKTGVLWTTTEAFNLIILQQLDKIFELIEDSIEFKELKHFTRLIWFSYLRKSGLAFTPEESEDVKRPTRRLHPASRFRDQQILTNRVEDCLHVFKNGSTALGFNTIFKLGGDGVVRTAEESDSLKQLDSKSTIEMNFNFFDVFYDRYRDPRNYAKYKAKELKISKESRRQLMEVLSKIDLQTSFEKTIDLMDEIDGNESIDDINSDSEEEEGKTKTDPEISEDLNKLGEDLDEYDRELMANLPETTNLYSKYIPLSVLKKSKYISSDYFIDLMSLPKTIAILNIVIRLLSLDIYSFDLIRWAIEGHIPYNNCLTCLPDDWLFISNDFYTFTSNCVPSSETINTLSAQIAKHIRINSFPRPRIDRLLVRIVKDLNLPKDIVFLIQTNYDLFEHFPKIFDLKLSKCRAMKQLPIFERWALMSVLIILKKTFVLNDSTEKRLSLNAPNDPNLFVWSEWEEYARLRLELIRSYFIPSCLGNLEDIQDVDLIADYVLNGTEYELTKTIETKKTANYRWLDFRADTQTEFKALLLDEIEFKSSEPVKPSLYPLINATDFVINRINSTKITDKLSISFENKSMNAWNCSHGHTFHRGYEFLAKDANLWSNSFKLLIELSCFVLNCRPEVFIPILNQMEKTYFGKNSD